MLELSDKLKKFSTEVLGEASQLSKKQWENFLEKQKADFDKKETEYLESGYQYIQNGLKQIDKEKSSLVSKSLMENKQKVLRKRMEIVDEIFGDLKKKLVDFTATPDYRTLLENRIEKTIQMLGEGKKKIVLSVSDSAKIAGLEKKYPGISFETESRQTKNGIIGGCRGYHLDNHVFYDNSFAEQMSKQREDFLQTMATDLIIED